MTEDMSQKVMVVEDFEDNRFMMRRLLEMSGYRVVEAMNGEEAVEIARREQPNLILMDLSLPLWTGLPLRAAYASTQNYAMCRLSPSPHTTRLTSTPMRSPQAATTTSPSRLTSIN
jgi:CheY-like chemotaxis protein